MVVYDAGNPFGTSTLHLRVVAMDDTDSLFGGVDRTGKSEVLGVAEITLDLNAALQMKQAVDEYLSQFSKAEILATKLNRQKRSS